jgi:hypothetical protein
MTALDQEHQSELDRRYDELYERFGKPLESQHRGQYLAISPDGKTVLGTSLLEVAERAEASFGPGNFLYRIGERAVGKAVSPQRPVPATDTRFR